MATKFVSLDKLSHFLLKLKEIIPTKTSELTNDSNFVVDDKYVHTDANYTAAEKTKLEGIEAGANKYTLPTASASTLGGVKIGANVNVASDGTISVTALEWDNITNRPTALSAFTNDENFITKSVSDLTNYYTKASTYSREEVNNIVSGIKTIQFQVVASLPTTGQSNIIYLLTNGGTTPNIYDEYIWVASGDTGSFEKIGSTDIDLSGYWKKEDLVECTNDEIDSLFTA